MQKSINFQAEKKPVFRSLKIAAVMPRILILDEPTNNLDLETKEHVINVLKNYPGANIAISHDSGFLKDIRIYNNYWIIKDLLCRL